jgi:hypothetical protein
MMRAITSPGWWDDPAPVAESKPLNEQRPEPSLPAGASMRLLEALTGERGDTLPSNATQRMRLALTGGRA